MTLWRSLLALPLLSLAFTCLAEEYIESFHSDIEVRLNGDLNVTETLVVRAEGKSIRRGIYRDFPTLYTNPQGRKVSVGFEVLSVQRDGRAESYHLKNRSNGKRVYIGDPNILLSPGFYEYQINYTTTRQLGFFDEFDELYWNVTGNGWSFRIDRASARVTLPVSFIDFQLTGYTGPQGSTAQNLVYRRSAGNQAYFETSQPLGRQEGLTIVASWPKGVVDEPSDAQRRAWFFEDYRPSLIVVGGALALFAYYLVLWRWFGRDPETGVIVPLYQPPEEYSPASMRFVQNMGYDKKCFTSAIINLAVKGAVEINDDEGQFKVIKQETRDLSLAPGEAQVLSGLFGEGRDNISIDQSNHVILSRAIGKHKISLKRDYEKTYFNTNSRLLFPGILATVIVIATAVSNLPSEEIIMKTIFFGVFTAIPLIMLSAVWRGFKRRGKGGKFQVAINLVVLVVFCGALVNNVAAPIIEFSEVAPLPLIAGALAMVAMHYFFYQWLKAPTLAGRRVLDKIEGFKHYLKVAEEDEIALTEAPEFTIGIYETYLPYAIALDLENEWTAKLNRAIAFGLVDRRYSHPGWYHARGNRDDHFSSALSSSMDSAISSSSVAPGSSSGSSGGSSGGGGGGGGGGGW
ncbi:MAG: DUF2207 domain-containing protein [Gammaproteobacteria bacterium]|nr:DUF2207 domain-containing protein [Gammaproteobacteria bacterium]